MSVRVHAVGTHVEGYISTGHVDHGINNLCGIAGTTQGYGAGIRLVAVFLLILILLIVRQLVLERGIHAVIIAVDERIAAMNIDVLPFKPFFRPFDGELPVQNLKGAQRLDAVVASSKNSVTASHARPSKALFFGVGGFNRVFCGFNTQGPALNIHVVLAFKPSLRGINVEGTASNNQSFGGVHRLVKFTGDVQRSIARKG